MWLILLVYVSDALVTFFAAKSQRALLQLMWTAIWWDGLLTIAIGLNAVGFVEQKWIMIIPSTLGSMTGMAIAVYNGRKLRNV